jgi:hypothetical protein
MAKFDRSKDAGIAPTLLLSAQMYTFRNDVLMIYGPDPAG